MTMEDEGDGNSVDCMQSQGLEEFGVGDFSTATNLPHKLTQKDVNDGETQIIFVGIFLKIFI